MGDSDHVCASKAWNATGDVDVYAADALGQSNVQRRIVARNGADNAAGTPPSGLCDASLIKHYDKMCGMFNGQLVCKI